MIERLQKVAGILDKIQDKLCPEIFDENGKMYDKVRKILLERMYLIVPKEQVREAYVIGSITGYQYTDDTDIDINVVVKREAVTPELNKVRKVINGKVLDGTKHPVNYMIKGYPAGSFKKYPEEQEVEFEFGVYDLLEDKWFSKPRKLPYTNPWQYFHSEIKTALWFEEEFNRRLAKYNTIGQEIAKIIKLKEKARNDVERYAYDKLLEKYQKLFEMYKKDLAEFIHQIDRERRIAYKVKVGIPRNNEKNITYKIIEDGPYNTIFETLNDWRPDLENIKQMGLMIDPY